MMTVLSFIYKEASKVSFFRVGEIEFPVNSLRRGRKQKKTTAGALKLRLGKGEEKKL